jgi:tripartite-type tricarboxylate transporter receptor subunit TctC
MRRCVRHGMFAVASTTEGRPQSPQAMEDDMHLTRRKVLHLGGAAALAYPSIALAQPYPARPVRVIVGFPPGGGYDILARLIGQWLTERLGQAFIIENRPSAGGNIGTETVVKAAADGYTLLLCGASNTINTTLYDRLSFNFTRDIAPVAGVARSPLVLQVHPSVPVKTLPEFIAYAKANPGKIDMGSAGNGTPQHVSGELFKMMTGLNITHVPYRGSGPALIGVLGAQVHVLFESTTSSIEYIRTGKLRPLAVTTATRSPALPNVPTVSEFVPGYEASSWYGIGAPRNTPAEIVDKLNQEVNACLAEARAKARFAEMAATVFAGTRAEFGRFISDDTEKWAKVIRFSNIKAD